MGSTTKHLSNIQSYLLKNPGSYICSFPTNLRYSTIYFGNCSYILCKLLPPQGQLQAVTTKYRPKSNYPYESNYVATSDFSLKLNKIKFNYAQHRATAKTFDSLTNNLTNFFLNSKTLNLNVAWIEICYTGNLYLYYIRVEFIILQETVRTVIRPSQ